MENGKTVVEDEVLQPKKGKGVSDGDGGSIERDDALETEEQTEKGNENEEREEDDEDENPLEDEGDWANNPNELTVARGNSLGNELDTKRENESGEIVMNNPRVRIEERRARFNQQDYGVVFLDSDIRAIACGAWYSVKGE